MGDRDDKTQPEMNLKRFDQWPLIVVGVVVGVLIFMIDWSGFCKWDPDLFSPKPLREVWWHLPLEIGAAIGLVGFLGWSGGEQSHHRTASLRSTLLLTATVLLVGGVFLQKAVGWTWIDWLNPIAALLLIVAILLSSARTRNE